MSEPEFDENGEVITLGEVKATRQIAAAIVSEDGKIATLPTMPVHPDRMRWIIKVTVYRLARPEEIEAFEKGEK